MSMAAVSNPSLNPIGGLNMTTCLKLLEAGTQKLSTGCDMIDQFLKGGFVPGKLYEIYGESGSGKTQFSIQLLLQSLLATKDGGLDGLSLYLMTGKPLNERRFTELKDGFLANNDGKISEQDVYSKIIFSHCSSLEEYNKVFLNLGQRVQSDRLRLIILDNIQAVANNFVRADGQVDFIERSNFLLKHARALKRLAYQYKIVVIVINNVSSEMGQQDNAAFFSDRHKGLQPALGLLWSNQVNERLCLKKRKFGPSGPNEDNLLRQMLIEKSSFMRRGDLRFEISSNGLNGKL